MGKAIKTNELARRFNGFVAVDKRALLTTVCMRDYLNKKSVCSLPVFLNVAVYGERRVEIAVETFSHKYPRCTTTFVVLQESREFGSEVIEWES